MVAAVDTSVLLEVLLNDWQYRGSSMAARRRASEIGSRVICETILAEMAPELTANDIPSFQLDRPETPEGWDGPLAL